MDITEIFKIENEEEFNTIAIETFKNQYRSIEVYKKYIDTRGLDINKVDHFKEIPFLPIEFFKTFSIKTSKKSTQKTFMSSGTTNSLRSKHHVTDLSIYESSFLECFYRFYGNPKDWIILSLLPSYIEQGDSSLIYMVNHLMKMTKNKNSQFINIDNENLHDIITKLVDKKVLLIGVSYALLDLSEKFNFDLSKWTIMETGGMKGRRKELIRSELHSILNNAFQTHQIHSEYGMTELLSQAYSSKEGVFTTPPWMKILVREVNDPFNYIDNGKTGGLNIIDLANQNSCSFIETKDLGRKINTNDFEISGRFDQSDIRGCNLMNIAN
ncbi:MAG: acyl transferase [Flavobacteriales bacterium]|nr:acyl transferase [Flavobacteriales bacterium]